tara:strand:- start:1195 stop:2166 length:972 start_codon:yes stop_codon:yes gene_type:complete
MENHKLYKSRFHTNTSLGKWSRCQFLWDCLHNENINIYEEPINYVDGPALAFGHIFHLCLEYLYLGKDVEQVLEMHMDRIPVLEDNLDTIKMRAMLEGRKRCKQELGMYTNIKYIEKELELSVTIADEEYAGKLDGIVEVDNNGVTELWNIDHKTYGRRRFNRYKQFHQNQQQTMYVYLARNSGYNVKGYIIDNWRVPGLTWKVNETKDEYRDKCVKDIMDITERDINTKSEDNSKKQLRKNDIPYFNNYYYPIDKKVIEEMYRSVENKILETQITIHFNKDFNMCYDGWGECEMWNYCHNPDIKLKDLDKTAILHPELTIAS